MYGAQAGTRKADQEFLTKHRVGTTVAVGMERWMGSEYGTRDIADGTR